MRPENRKNFEKFRKIEIKQNALEQMKKSIDKF